MERMLGRSRPFYKAGPVMRLQKIPADRFAAVHRSALQGERHQGRSRASAPRSSSSPATCPTTSSGSRTRSGTMPGRADGRTADLDDLHATLQRLLGEHETLFEGTWQRLTLAQRGALRAAVLEDGRELLSADVRIALSPGRHVDRPGLARRARCAKTSSRAKATATSSSTRCFANGSRGGRSDGIASMKLRLLDRLGLGTPRAARLGDVRLGELRVPDHDHRGGLPDLLPQGRRGRPAAGRWPPAGSPGRRPSRSSSSRSSRRSSAPSPTTRR